MKLNAVIPMPNKNDKSAIILEQEEQFAIALASQIINKPQLSLWMILIPIFFVFYFNNLNKCRNDRKIFAENYIIDKKRALDEALDAVIKGREPEIPALAELPNINSGAREKQADILAILAEHYRVLLNSEGEDFASLIRSAYGNLTNYLLFINHLNKAEKEVNKALQPDLEKSLEGVNDIMGRMEDLSARFRRETAESIFR